MGAQPASGQFVPLFFCCIRSSKSLDELVGLARGAPHGTWYWRLSVNPLNPDSGLGAVPLGPGFSPPGRIDQQTK